MKKTFERNHELCQLPTWENHMFRSPPFPHPGEMV